MVQNKLLLLWLCLFLLCNLPSVDATSPDGYLLISKIGLYEYIYHIPDSDLSPNSYYYDLSQLSVVGHLQNTSWDDLSGGRLVLVGHTPGVFSSIGFLESGDEIVLLIGTAPHYFTVFDKYIVKRYNDNILSTSAYQFEVVLVTCTENSDERLIIKAR